MAVGLWSQTEWLSCLRVIFEEANGLNNALASSNRRWLESHFCSGCHLWASWITFQPDRLTWLEISRVLSNGVKLSKQTSRRSEGLRCWSINLTLSSRCPHYRQQDIDSGWLFTVSYSFCRSLSCLPAEAGLHLYLNQISQKTMTMTWLVWWSAIRSQVLICNYH